MRKIVLAAVVVLSACGIGGVQPSGASGKVGRQPIISCPSSPAREVFTAALCLCGDYRAVGQGAWVQGGPAALNGTLDVVGTHDFSGDLRAWGGVTGVGQLTVGGTLSTPAKVDGVGKVEVTNDLVAGSGLSSVGELKVGGTLWTPEGEAWTSPGATVGAKATYQPLGDPPCACGEDAPLDVAAAIAAARTANDNLAAGLSLHEHVGDEKYALGSGSYVFDGISVVGQHALTVDGAVAIYVSGDFSGVGTTGIELTPGSTLDLYVDGDVDLVGSSSFGAGATPGAVKLYVSPGHTVSMVGGQDVVAAVYAPGSDLELVGESKWNGALFMRNVDGVGSLELHYSAPAVAEPTSELCTAPLN
ncbi:MAG: hypothetical protein U0228_18340 [Myxococcaceae bacterium]